MTTPPRHLSIRTAEFADRVRSWAGKIFAHLLIKNDLEQLLASSGSVAANFVEAHESLGKKDSAMRMKICRKEAKESRVWLELLKGRIPQTYEGERALLSQEADELTRIFHAIIIKHYS